MPTVARANTCGITRRCGLPLCCALHVARVVLRFTVRPPRGGPRAGRRTLAPPATHNPPAAGAPPPRHQPQARSRSDARSLAACITRRSPSTSPACRVAPGHAFISAVRACPTAIAYSTRRPTATSSAPKEMTVCAVVGGRPVLPAASACLTRPTTSTTRAPRWPTDNAVNTGSCVALDESGFEKHYQFQVP